MDPEKRNKIKTLSADKGYDSEDLIKEIKEYEIKPIIDIQNHWKDSDKTKNYFMTLYPDYPGMYDVDYIYSQN